MRLGSEKCFCDFWSWLRSWLRNWEKFKTYFHSDRQFCGTNRRKTGVKTFWCPANDRHCVCWWHCQNPHRPQSERLEFCFNFVNLLRGFRVGAKCFLFASKQFLGQFCEPLLFDQVIASCSTWFETTRNSDDSDDFMRKTPNPIWMTDSELSIIQTLKL